MMDMEELDPAAPAGGHVVRCGPNELGYRTLEELVRLGEHVVVVVRSPAEELAPGARELGRPWSGAATGTRRCCMASGFNTSSASMPSARASSADV